MSPIIVPADEQLLGEIEVWLDEEQSTYGRRVDEWEDQGCVGPPPTEGFRCNWDSVIRGWRDGRASVSVLLVDGEAVGFLDGTDILEIRPDQRGKGYGAIMARHMLLQAGDQGYCVVEIEIAPASARPFWERMGFEVVGPQEEYRPLLRAVRFIDKNFELGQGSRVRYEIGFFRQSDRFASTPRPFALHEGEGVRLPNGDIQLPRRICCYDKARSGEDSFVRIAINGDELHFDKVKYPESAMLGFREDPHRRFYIDRILAPPSVLE